MKPAPLVAVAAVALGGWLFFRGGSEAFAWSHDWPSAVETARSQAKPILLLFGGPW